jgi:hypothetical protein
MAGAGYKLFNTGDVLTAAQVNTYLQEQVVMVFADATARTTALSGVLAEGMVSYLKDTNATEVYDGSSWVGIGNSGDITGVTAGTGISGGGTSGTVTITNDMATTITAAGDIVVGTGSGTYDNLPIGTTGQVLTADTTVSPYKVKWATAGGGGSLIYVTTNTFSASSSVTIDNCFTSTYNNYFIVLENVTIASGSDVRLRTRLRASGSSDTTSNYRDGRRGQSTAGSFDQNLATTTAWSYMGNVDSNASGGPNNSQIVLYSPQAANQTAYTAVVATSDAIQFSGGTFRATTQFDGIEIYPDSSTISGKIKIYGIKDS